MPDPVAQTTPHRTPHCPHPLVYDRGECCNVIPCRLGEIVIEGALLMSDTHAQQTTPHRTPHHMNRGGSGIGPPPHNPNRVMQQPEKNGG